MTQALIKENLLPGNNRLRLSPSKLICWDECPARFKNLILQPASNTDTIYTCIGKAAHYVIEQVNKGIQLTPSERGELIKRRLIEECSETGTPLNFSAKGFHESREVVNNYRIPEGWRLLQAEKKNVIEFAKYDFSYIIDGLWHDTIRNEIVIIDYKTSAQAPKSPLQLMLYAWATSKLYPDILEYPIKSAFHMLRTDKIVEHPITADTIAEMDKYMATNVDLIIKSFKLDYFPEKGGSYCRFCEIEDCESREG
jgi:hypothetical protein